MTSGSYEEVRRVKKQIARETHKLKKTLAVRHKCSGKRQLLVLGQIPIFLTMAECIRLMAGARQSALGMAAQAFSPRAGEAVNARFDQAVEGTVAAKRELWLEPSMSTDGALWIPDLTLADPYHIMPATVSMLTFISVYNQSKPPSSATIDDKNELKREEKPGPRALRRLLLGFSMMLFPLTLEIPAAVMVYWAGSTASAMFFNFTIDRRWPLKAPPRTCKRPLPVRQKAWDRDSRNWNFS